MPVPTQSISEFAARGLHHRARPISVLKKSRICVEHFFAINAEQHAIRERDAKSDNTVVVPAIPWRDIRASCCRIALTKRACNG